MNNFSLYLTNIEKMEKMKSIIFQIDYFINSVPRNAHSCLPKGGLCYLEMLKKYEQK